MSIRIRRLLRPFSLRTSTFLILILIGFLAFRSLFMSTNDTQNVDVPQNLPHEQSNIKVSIDNKVISNNNNNNIENTASKEIDPECEIDDKCTGQSIPYLVISGDGYDKYPVICFNGKLIVSKSIQNNKINRGINLVTIKTSDNKYEVDKIETFDTFSDDARFFRFIKTEIADGDLLIMASYDEMASGLKELSYGFMEYYGSRIFRNVRFRDSYVMIGQRGAAKGKAIESLEPKQKSEFAPAAKISGCLHLPLGTLNPVPVVASDIHDKTAINVSGVVPNCGLSEPCANDEFPVHIFTGKDTKVPPKICVDGKYVIDKDLNDAGRGLNVVVVGNGKEVLKTAHFDTYTEDSTNLEIFLENLYDNVIVIVVTFDEASNKLGSLAKNLLFELGSGFVQNLKHRDAWYFVGQRGIKGFSIIEEISYAGSDGAYPVPLDKRFCVPQTLKGIKIKPDPLPIANDKRREFCSKHDGYGEFCFDHNLDKMLRPAPIINKTLADHPIYKTPILVVSGFSHNALRMSLETIIMQPGINPEMVYVAYDEKLEELPALISLFGFNSVKTSSSFKYVEQLEKALEAIFDNPNLKEKNAVIVVEEELIASPDFLYFLLQMYDIYMADENLATVSTWNPNSYLELNGNANKVYRVQEAPGYGFLLKRGVFDKYIKGNFANCCSERAWKQWSLGGLDSLVPDVSRVFRRPFTGIHQESRYLDALFNRHRKTNLLPFPDIEDKLELASQITYDAFIKNKLNSAIDFPGVQDCFSKNNIKIPDDKSNVYYKIIYEQASTDDYKKLSHLCECFNLFYADNYNPKALYKGVLRFSIEKNNYILIGAMSPLLK